MERTSAPGTDATRQLLQLGVATLVAAVVVVALVTRHEPGTQSPARGTGPVLVSAEELRRFAASIDHPVFWSGPRDGASYELTATPGGRIFVRYLPAGVAAGDARADFLAVGTYRSSRPYADLERAARADDAVGLPLADGRLALMSRHARGSVYLARRGSPYQVEVYDPSVDTARNLVISGSIRPVR